MPSALPSPEVAAVMRCIGFLIAVPFGSTWLRFGIRIALALLLAILFSQSIATSFSTTPLSYLPFELILGFILGLPLSLLVHGANMFGNLYDLGRGQTIAQIYDPLTGGTPSVCALLYQYAFFSMLLSSNAFLATLLSLKESFEIFPNASIVLEPRTATLLAKLIGFSLSGVFSLFLVVGLLFLLVEFGAIFIGLAVPRLSLLSDSFMLKSLAGFLMMLMILKSKTLNEIIGVSTRSLALILREL